MLAVSDLHVFRGERHVLRGVSFQVAAGQYGEVTGANGSGKTTLLRTLCGLVIREQGAIAWRDRDTSAAESNFLPSMSYLGHDPPLKGDFTARENLRYSVGFVRPLPDTELSAGLDRTGALSFADRPVRTLSAGQRRRVALAALWLRGASLWLLDEPTTNLDTAGHALVAGLIDAHLKAGGVAVAAVHQPLGLDAARTVSIVLRSAAA